MCLIHSNKINSTNLSYQNFKKILKSFIHSNKNKMQKFIPILILALLGFTACKNKSDHSHDGHDHDSHQHESTNKEEQQSDELTSEDVQEHQASESDTLYLNNDKKWIVNTATHVGMYNMKNLLTKYVIDKSTDHKTLGNALSAEAQTLISKCDMVGKDHEMLHVILHPILETIETISESESNEHVTQLNKQLSDYFVYFEPAK